MVPVAPAESLSVELTGRGDPVVLIPGLFGSAFGFRKLVPLLVTAGYRTIVIEPLGVGASGRPEKANYSLTAQADRIAAVLDSLHVRRALVLAHSIGGSEAFRLAYRRPDLVRALLSIEGGPTERAITPAFKRALRLAPWIKLLGGIRLIRRKIRGMLMDSSGDASWVTDSVVLGYTAAAGRDLDATLKAYLAMANAREPELLAPHLPQVRCPVRLMVGGARRVTTGWRRRRRLEELFRAGRYDIVHVHGGLAPTLGLAAPFAAWRVGIPVVATFHSWFRRSIACRVFRRPLQRILDRHAATIAVSSPVVDANARYFRAQWDIIPNGVDTTFFRPNGRAPTDALTEGP